jgi:hypothetical protein
VSPSPPRTGVLVVRAWVEGDLASGGLRVRIVRTLDVTGPESESSSAATPDEVYRVVRLWLEALMAV